MKQFTARAYNHFSIDPVKSILYKKSETDRLADEIGYYKDIHNTDLSCFFPRLFRSNIDHSNGHSMGLEYYGYNNLESYNGSWDKVAQKLQDVLNLFQGYESSLDSIKLIEHRKKMYVDKTLHYHKDLIDNFPVFKTINDRQSIKINGQLIYTFDEIWDSIERLIDICLINDNSFSVIHGDMCFSNILYDEDRDIIKFIDPRGSFGEKGIYGDPLYDVAKLIHSFSGLYEYIIYDKFNVIYNEGSIDYTFADDQHIYIKNAFLNHQIFNNVKAKLIEGLIFIGMCSRHYDSLDRQLVMYSTGLKILNGLLVK